MFIQNYSHLINHALNIDILVYYTIFLISVKSVKMTLIKKHREYYKFL